MIREEIRHSVRVVRQNTLLSIAFLATLLAGFAVSHWIAPENTVLFALIYLPWTVLTLLFTPRATVDDEPVGMDWVGSGYRAFLRYCTEDVSDVSELSSDRSAPGEFALHPSVWSFILGALVTAALLLVILGIWMVMSI